MPEEWTTFKKENGPVDSLVDALRAQDFVVRYAAFQLFSQGKNPYDPSLLRPLEQQLSGWDVNIPFLNPPWTLLLLAPVMPFSYEWSALLWAIANVGLAFLSVALLGIAVRGRLPRIPQLLQCLCFLPVLFCLIWGQLGLLMAAGMSFLIFANQRGSVSAAVTGIVLLSVKPHLYFLLVLIALWQILKTRKVLVPLLSLLVLGSLLLICEIVSPGITAGWLAASKGGVEDLRRLRSCNIPAVAALMLARGQPLSLVPLFVIPAFSALVCLLWLWKRKPKFENPLAIASILCLSLLLAPYAWHHDFAVLLTVQTLLVLAAPAHLRKTVGIGLTLMNVAVCVQMYFAFQYVMEFVWIPAVLFLLSSVAWRAERTVEMGGVPLSAGA